MKKDMESHSPQMDRAKKRHKMNSGYMCLPLRVNYTILTVKVTKLTSSPLNLNQVNILPLNRWGGGNYKYFKCLNNLKDLRIENLGSPNQ